MFLENYRVPRACAVRVDFRFLSFILHLSPFIFYICCKFTKKISNIQGFCREKLKVRWDMQMSITKRAEKIFTRRTPFFIGATRNFQKSTSFEKYSMSFAKYSMSFAQKSAPLGTSVFIGVSEGWGSGGCGNDFSLQTNFCAYMAVTIAVSILWKNLALTFFFCTFAA